jgi:glycerate kinase
LEERIQAADLVITGEGKLDASSLQGKVVGGVAAFCRKHQKRCVVVVGESVLTEGELASLALDGVYSVMDFAEDRVNGMENSRAYLEALGKELGRGLG